MYYDLNKVSLSRGGSYIDSPEWLRNKKATTNSKNNDDQCFQHALTVALNYQNIKNNPERMSKIKPFIEQHKWKETDFSSHREDWKKFQTNNKTIALNILCAHRNSEEIRPAFVSEHNLKREIQAVFLMITDGEKWHYLTVKILSTLLRGITSNNNGDIYCLNCFRKKT